MKKHNYVAVVLLESSSGHKDYTPLYDETTILIAADSLEEAKVKAASYGAESHTKFKNKYGMDIEWKLRKVVDVNDMLNDDFENDIVEVYSRHFSDISSYECIEESASATV